LREELGDAIALDDATIKKYEGLLEKKWTSVVRLQKKIMDLESRNAALQSELDFATPYDRRIQDPVSWLPRTRQAQSSITSSTCHLCRFPSGFFLLGLRL